MGLSLSGSHTFPGQRWWPSASYLMISKPVFLPCLPFLTGQLLKQSLGLDKVQSNFVAGEKNLLLWKPGRELLVTSTACSVPIASEVPAFVPIASEVPAFLFHSYCSCGQPSSQKLSVLSDS